MTKEQMSAELDKAKVELEQLRKDDKQREDELTAVTMARMPCREQNGSGSVGRAV